MRILTIIGLLAVMPTAAAAQSPTVPMDLVRALLAGASPFGPQNWVEVVVEGPPKRWGIEPLDGFRLMGSAAFTTSATVAYEVSGDIAEAAAEARRRFIAAGWQAPPEPDMRTYERGFMSTASPFVTRTDVLCKPDRAARIFTLQPEPGKGVLLVSYMGSSGMCNPLPGRPPGYRDIYAEMPIPNLRPPKGVDVRRASGGGGGTEFRSTAYARTDMPVGKLLDAYAEQIRAEGWQQDAAAAGTGAGLQTWRRKHNGNDWSLSISGVTLAERFNVLQLDIINITQTELSR